MRIVYVEDHPADRRSYGSVLQAHGYEVALFDSAPLALNEMRQRRPDVLLTEHHLIGGPNGITLAREVRSLYPDTAILILSGYHGKDELLNALRANVDDYLLKPTESVVLLQRVGEAILRRQALFPTHRYETTNYDPDDPLRLDIEGHSALWYGRALPLTRTEFALLVALATRSGKTLGYSELYGLCSGVYTADPVTARSKIKSHVNNLRQKLARYGRCQPIQTVQGMGWKWELPEGLT